MTNPQDNFRNRRKMAWGSFFALIAFMLTMLYRLSLGDDPNKWTGLGTMVIGCFTGIVTTYAIAATYEKIKGVQPPAQ